jgi:hypothetical protein
MRTRWLILLAALLMCGAARAQSETQIRAIGTALQKSLKKGKYDALADFGMTRENFEKYFRAALMDMMPEGGSDMAGAMDEEIERMHYDYLSAFQKLKMAADELGVRKELKYSHFYAREGAIDFAGLRSYCIGFVFKAKNGDFYTIYTDQTVEASDKIILGPKFTIHKLDARKAANCLQMLEEVSEDLIGSFSGECAFLNDMDALYAASEITGMNEEEYTEDVVDYEGVEEDPYSYLNICNCKSSFAEYDNAMREAMMIQDENERKLKVIEVNEALYYGMQECHYAVQYYLDTGAYNTEAAIFQDCP